MFQWLRNALRQIMTDAKGQLDHVRLIAVAGFLVLSGCVIALLILHGQFDSLSYGGAVGTIAGAAGAGSGLKSRMGGDG